MFCNVFWFILGIRFLFIFLVTELISRKILMLFLTQSVIILYHQTFVFLRTRKLVASMKIMGIETLVILTTNMELWFLAFVIKQRKKKIFMKIAITAKIMTVKCTRSRNLYFKAIISVLQLPWTFHWIVYQQEAVNAHIMVDIKKVHWHLHTVPSLVLTRETQLRFQERHHQRLFFLLIHVQIVTIAWSCI